MKALAHRFVSSIITERLDEFFLCDVIFRPTYAASTSPEIIEIVEKVEEDDDAELSNVSDI